MTRRTTMLPITALSLLLLAGAGMLLGQDGSDGAGDNLAYWLEQSSAGDAEPDIQDPPDAAGEGAPLFALPGTVEDQRGQARTGRVWRGQARALEVHETQTNRWRRVPLAACLSIEAALDARMENEWTWSETGDNEKVYTGQRYPVADITWTFLLADGRKIVGTVKGQSLFFIPDATNQRERLILPLKVRGQVGQTLDELACPARIIISARVRDELLESVHKPQTD